MIKNGFLTFIFSFIPGAGQMYQGYMKRGCSLMILFALSCSLTAVAATPIFAIPLPIIFAFSFFDTFNIRTKLQNSSMNDEYIWSQWINKNEIAKDGQKCRIIGYILVAFGVYLLINSVFRELAYQYHLEQLTYIINFILRYLSTTLVAAFAIGIGVKFISKK